MFGIHGETDGAFTLEWPGTLGLDVEASQLYLVGFVYTVFHKLNTFGIFFPFI